jgi:lysozyme
VRPETPDQPNTPEENVNGVSTPKETQNSETHSAKFSAEHKVRSAANRVRPVAQRSLDSVLALLERMWQALVPLIARVREIPAVQRVSERVGPQLAALKEKLDLPQTQSGQQVPVRVRSMQAGAALAAVGVVSLVVGTMSTGSQQQASNVEEAAQAAPMQAPQGGGEQAAPAPAPKNSAPAEQKRPAPIGPPVEGIDVSNHNGSINWDAVAADGKKFTFVLATDGDNFTSPSYSKQYHGAKEAGLMAGAYHFARPDDSSGREQAERFLAVADYQKDGKTLPPVLDLEVDPSTGGCYGMTVSEMQEWTREFNETVQEKTGKDAIIYANPSFWRQCMGGTSEFSDQPLWMASYGVNSPSVLSGFDDWDFWQYTDKGSVSGISGYTDLNKYQYGIERLKQLAS